MSAAQPFLAVVLLGLAVYFGRQQVLSLRALRAPGDISAEDHSYFRRQAWLRLASCGFMILLAGLLGVGSGMGLEQRADELGEAVKARTANGETVALDAEQKQFRRWYVGYWISALLLLLAVVCLAGFDLWAIRRYGNRHMRQIREDRKAMFQEELARLRSQRNGHS